jgi:hypothetical protein
MMSKVIWLTGVMLLALSTRGGVAQQSRATSHEIVQLRSDQTLFNPNSKKALSYRDSQLIIALVNGKKNLAVDVKSPSNPGGRVELPAEIVQVNEMRATQGGKAVVVGMVNGSVFEIVILNTHPLGIADTFLAYSPTVSPDTRLIAFVKFYPAHFVEGTEDHYLLYDVARSAADNRPVNVSLNDHTNVGIEVYPHVANQGGDNTGVPPQQQHHMLAQRFFWQSDSARYVFADDYAGEWDVVLVAIADGVPSASKITVPKNEVCALLRKESCQVTLAEAELTPSGLLASFQGVAADSALDQVIEYGYQQLSPVR